MQISKLISAIFRSRREAAAPPPEQPELKLSPLKPGQKRIVVDDTWVITTGFRKKGGKTLYI